MEKSSVYVDGEQEALRYKWIESEKAGLRPRRGRHPPLGAVSLVGLPAGPLAGTSAGQTLLGRTGPRRLRPAATQVPRQHPSPRPHPRSPQGRPGKPRHHLLGARPGASPSTPSCKSSKPSTSTAAASPTASIPHMLDRYDPAAHRTAPPLTRTTCPVMITRRRRRPASAPPPPRPPACPSAAAASRAAPAPATPPTPLRPRPCESSPAPGS